MSTASAPLASRLRRARPPAPAQAPPSPAPTGRNETNETPEKTSPAPPRVSSHCPRTIIERGDLAWPEAPRIQIRRRRKGRLLIPPGAVVIIGEWGSPFRIRVAPAGCKPYRVDWHPIGLAKGRPCPTWWEPINCPDRRSAQREILAALELWLGEPEQADLVEAIRTKLRGKILACYCGPATPCHGDVLIAVANA